MAQFINRQEEVLEIELTPYGKYLFSQGKFDPQYYSFYDDDILYDGIFGGLIETQNDIATRVKNTERISLFSNFSGSVRNNQTNSNIISDSFQKLTAANAKFFRCLGNNSPWSDYSPAWMVSTMPDSALFAVDGTNSFYSYESEYSVPVVNATLEMEYSGSSEDFIYNGEVVPFTSYATMVEDKLVIDIQELNTLFKVGGNYDVEIFKIPRNQTGEEQIKQLSFIDPEADNSDLLYNQVSDPYLVSYLQSDAKLENLYPILNPSYVEYYLNVRVDTEITDIPDFRNGLYSTNRSNSPQEPCD
jgi:hypothetical protein